MVQLTGVQGVADHGLGECDLQGVADHGLGECDLVDYKVHARAADSS